MAFGSSDPYPPIPDPAPVGGYGSAYGAYGNNYGGYLAPPPIPDPAPAGGYGSAYGDYGGYGGLAPPPIPGPAPAGGYGSAYGAYGDPTQRGFFERAGDWLGSEKGQRALQQLSGFSAGMLQGSSPSLQPRNFYTGLGAGMEGIQKAGSQYYEDALKRSQTALSAAKVGDLQTWSKVMQDAAANATGLPPGYGMPSSGGTVPQATPASVGAGGGGGQGGWGPLAQPAIGALSAAGLSPAAQQAVMGHGLAEGGFNDPWRAGDNGNSFGHWQFNKGGELPGYVTWAQGKGDPQDTALQAQYVAKRMEEIHPGFSKVTDPAQAMAMVADFERYKGYQTNKRLGYLADAQKAMGGGELAPRMPIPPGYGQKPALADTPFQMPSNMAAGLGGPGGILPPVAPAPGATQPPAGPVAMLPSGAPVAPAPLLTAPPAAEPPPTTGTSAPAAARVAAAGTPSLAEGDSIAYGLQKYGGLPGNPKGGRNPEQVLQNIDGNLKRDPDYYRGKTVMLSSGVMNGPGRIDLVPEQIQRIQDAGGKVILAGVDTGKFAGHNGTLAQMAAEAGVPFAGALPTDNVHPGPDGYRQYLARVRRGAARVASAVDTGQAATAGGGGEGGSPGPTQPSPSADGLDPAIATTPAPVVGAQPPPVPPVTVPLPAPAPAAMGPLAVGGALQQPPGGAPAGAGPVLAQGTAPGMPVQPPAAGPAPAPPITAAPPGSPPPPAPGAVAGGPPGAMPGAIAPPTVAAPPTPLAVPNLGQVQPPGMGGLPPYDVNAARRAQILSLAGAATGHQVPAYLAEQAGLPTKALEQQWALQKEMYGQQLGAARDQWKAMSDLQKEQYSAQNGLQKSQVESDLRMREELFKKGQMIGPNGQIMNMPGSVPAEAERSGAVAQAQKDAEARAEFDRPREYKVQGSQGEERTIIATPRQMGATPPPVPGAAPAPGGTQAPGMPGTVGGYPSRIAPGRQEELTGEGKRLAEVATQVHSEAQTAVNSRADLEFLSALGSNISAPGPWASAMQSFNRVRQSVLGTAAEPVASYELAQQLMGGMMRTALRASDPNPTERQQAMMLASMPTPASSAEGFQEGIRHMQGLADYKVFKQQALINWQRDHDGSAFGFEGSFKLSAIPFVLDRMSDAQQTAYISKLQAKDPKALDRLRDQVEAVKNLNYTYKY